MSQTQPHSSLSRRDFLKFTAAAGVVAVGGHLLDTYAPWLDVNQQANDTRALLQQGAAGPEQMRELVRYATLAANGHNTQPWKFAIGGNEIQIHPDAARRLPVVDRNKRLVGVVSLGDIAQTDRVKAANTALRGVTEKGGMHRQSALGIS